jgi:hypothetical protein
MEEVQIEVGLADCPVIRIRDPRPGLPVKLFAHREHRSLIFLTVGRFGYCHEAGVHSGKSPILVEPRFGFRQLPIGNFLDGMADVLAGQLGRKISGQRRRGRGRVSDPGYFLSRRKLPP